MLIAIVMDSLPADHKKICIFHLDSHKWWCVSCKGWLFCVRQLPGFYFLQDPHLLSLWIIAVFNLSLAYHITSQNQQRYIRRGRVRCYFPVPWESEKPLGVHSAGSVATCPYFPLSCLLVLPRCHHHSPPVYLPLQPKMHCQWQPGIRACGFGAWQFCTKPQFVSESRLQERQLV